MEPTSNRYWATCRGMSVANVGLLRRHRPRESRGSLEGALRHPSRYRNHPARICSSLAERSRPRAQTDHLSQRRSRQPGSSEELVSREPFEMSRNRDRKPRPVSTQVVGHSRHRRLSSPRARSEDSLGLPPKRSEDSRPTLRRWLLLGECLVPRQGDHLMVESRRPAGSLKPAD